MDGVIELPARPLLWREAVGHELRRERVHQHRTQGDVADVAGISTQYLSEVERGRKEPSSEILEAVSGALDLDLADLVRRAAETLGPRVLVSAVEGPTTDLAGPVAFGAPVLLAA